MFSHSSSSLIEQSYRKGHALGNSYQSTPRRLKVYDRLYAESTLKREMKDSQQLRKTAKELEQCTFQPDISLTFKTASRIIPNRYSSSNSNSPFESVISLCDRLAAPQSERYRQLQRAKEEEELNCCTFQPELCSRDYFSHRDFDTSRKLYEDHSKMLNWIRLKQVEKDAQQLQECSFHPQTINAFTDKQKMKVSKGSLS